MSSCVLYRNSSATITILDIPRSIELAQGSTLESRHLISLKPLENPYPSVEPKSAKAKANVTQTSLENLLLVKHLEIALDEVKREHKGPWCLTRVTNADETPYSHERSERKKRRLEEINVESPAKAEIGFEVDHVRLLNDCEYFHNSKQAPLNVNFGDERSFNIPPKSTFLQGDILKTLSVFKEKAPKFDLVVLDPPWPNRSARRKQSYNVSYGKNEIQSLLSSIPLYDHLVNDAYVAIWITNKPSFRGMVLEESGLFDKWGVQLIEEWIWLKITRIGEPICALNSSWKKPYEILLIGRRGVVEGHAKRRVIVGVPDLHSRKPNFKTLFQNMMGEKDGFESLEIFARNLTAGWWSWGDEVLKFQTSEHWAP